MEKIKDILLLSLHYLCKRCIILCKATNEVEREVRYEGSDIDSEYSDIQGAGRG